MSNAFEEARHKGFSVADMAQEMKEKEERIQELGCSDCHYQIGFRACETIIEDDGETFPRCPYFKKEERA